MFVSTVILCDTGTVVRVYFTSMYMRIVLKQVNKCRNDAITGKQMSLYSPAFYVHRYGYKMCLRCALYNDNLND